MKTFYKNTMLLNISQSSTNTPHITGKDLQFYAQNNSDIQNLIQKLVNDIEALTKLTQVHVDIDAVLEQE